MSKVIIVRMALAVAIVQASLSAPLYAQIFAQSALTESRQNIDVEKARDITAVPEAVQGFENVVVQPVTPEQAELQIVTDAALAKLAPIELALRTGGGSAAPGVASFADMARALKNDPDLIYEYVRNNVEFIDNIIDIKRDFLLDFFGFKTLYRSYLLKVNGKSIVECPQHMFLRVALGLHVPREGRATSRWIFSH